MRYYKNLQKRIIALTIAVFCLLCGCAGEDAPLEPLQTEQTSIEQENVNVEDQWTITQYGPRETNMSFYTIYNPAKGLIVVDGGYTEDALYVAGIIQSLGGKVDAWILTHLHPDHAGAFNAIYPNQEVLEIEIGDIYTVQIPSPEECLASAPWDTAEAYITFLAYEIPDVIYLNTGDVLEICDLKFEVFSAFEENTKELTNDYFNDGSIMFKVYGETKDFLFCADVGKRMSEHIIENIGAEKLASDYLQMGHHGNGGLNADFYTLVSPTIAFFDAPDWLLNDQSGKYTTPQNKALMESLGSEIKSFSSAPNSIVLD